MARGAWRTPDLAPRRGQEYAADEGRRRCDRHRCHPDQVAPQPFAQLTRDAWREDAEAFGHGRLLRVGGRHRRAGQAGARAAREQARVERTRRNRPPSASFGQGEAVARQRARSASIVRCRCRPERVGRPFACASVQDQRRAGETGRPGHYPLCPSPGAGAARSHPRCHRSRGSRAIVTDCPPAAAKASISASSLPKRISPSA